MPNSCPKLVGTPGILPYLPRLFHRSLAFLQNDMMGFRSISVSSKLCDIISPSFVIQCKRWTSVTVFATRDRSWKVQKGELEKKKATTHCSKSSFFVQKFNFDFPRKIVDFFGGWKTREKVLILDFLAVDNFDFTRKIVKKIWVKNSWKCCGFGLFSCWQLWFHEENCLKKLGQKLVKMFGFCQNWISGQKFDF